MGTFLVMWAFCLMGLAIYSQNIMSGVVAVWILTIGLYVVGLKKDAQKITVTINNPLGESDWEAVSEQIIIAINKAGERNVTR